MKVGTLDEPRHRTFRDRTAAGAALSYHLARYHGPTTVVLGIPRGGVVVAAEVARCLAAGAAPRAEAERRERSFSAGRPLGVLGRTAILVDDGLATGSTMRAAVRSLRAYRPARIIVAAPVGSVQACTTLRSEADEVVCPFVLADFGAVSAYYADSRQTTADEVRDLLGGAVEAGAWHG